MKQKTITKSERSINLVSGEIRALETLIERRNKWLSDPINKQKGTFDAVKRDTIQMTYNLRDLKEELKSLTNKEED